ncbi:hypothetical protein D9M73_249470 [compost metagenome]
MRKVQGLGNHFPLRLPLWQQPAQHLPCLMGDPALGKARQVFSGKPIMQQRHGFIGCGQRCFHVFTLEDQRIERGVEHQRCVECNLVGLDIDRLFALHQYPYRLDCAASQPATQRQRTSQRGFGAVAGGR